jgi:ubiquinone/menaquinone biosynthesis C-methylase UbiE
LLLNLKYFADNNYRITGTDISLESLKIAKKFAPDANLYVKDTSKLDFDKNTFDLIICLYSIMHLDIEKQKKAFNKIYEMLIPGGYFRINFASKDYTGHDEFAGLRTFNGHSLPCYHTTQEKYEKIFLDLGFEIIDSKTKFTGVEEEIDLKNRKEIMSRTTKKGTRKDGMQTLQMAFNDVDASLTTNGFLVGKIGHKVTLEITTTTILGDTELYTFLDNDQLLYQIKLVYTDSDKAQLISAERIA